MSFDKLLVKLAVYLNTLYFFNVLFISFSNFEVKPCAIGTVFGSLLLIYSVNTSVIRVVIYFWIRKWKGKIFIFFQLIFQRNPRNVYNLQTSDIIIAILTYLYYRNVLGLNSSH